MIVEMLDTDRSELIIVNNTSMSRRIKRNHHKILNGVIILALIVFVLINIKGVKMPQFRARTTEGQQENGKLEPTATANNKKVNIKVPWRYQLEDDGFMFPKGNHRDKFIAYIPSPISWPKQLLQFENALIFAYLLDRTLLVPPLVHERNAELNSSSKAHFAMSNILDFGLLSKIVSLKETNLKYLENISNSSNTYKICHDHRLGFWVDFIPAVENIQLWRMLRAQQFTAFPVRLDDNEVDLMCPGTIQYGNRWGPPMKIKPIIRAIMTELYERDDDIIFFQGDTLSSKDFRFFDKSRTKTMQKILIFNVQFSNGVNLLMMQLIKYLGQTYNAVLSGPIYRNGSIREALELRLKIGRFLETSRTLLVVSRKSDEKEFTFLKKQGYRLIFKSDITKSIDTSRGREILGDLHDLCITLLCAYASKLITISGPSEEYFVEHLRLQNVSMKDGLVIDNINVRWAKHTQLPSRDERVLLARKNISRISNNLKINNTLSTKMKLNQNSTNFGINGSPVVFNATKYGNKTSIVANTRNVTAKQTFKKPKSKLDLMVCTFCLYLKRITGEHGCPTISQWCH